MKTKITALVACLGLAIVALAAAAPTGSAPFVIGQDDQRDLMLTVYSANLGLVKDVREARLPSGTAAVRFADVASGIDPTTVHLRSLTDPGAVRILEQSYEYDLVSSEKLMEKYVGRKVRVYAGDGTYHDATLLSTSGPVLDIDGQIHLGYAGRLVLPSLPENLVSRPTLAWLLRNQASGPQRVEASYLTSGLTWKADYVMLVNAADDRADLTGWVTIDNSSGATYANAALKLVAGDVHRAREPRRDVRALETAAKAATAPATGDFAAEGLFEYHLYTLDGRTTVKDRQVKQLALMSTSDVPLAKHLIYSGAADYYRTQYGLPLANQKVNVVLELRNGTEQHLGLPLPRGKVRVYKADRSGSEQLIGEDWIDHTPKDELLRIKVGDASDVVGERTQKEWRKIAANVYEVEWEIGLRNHKSEDQTVTVIEPVPGDWEVVKASHPYETIEGHTLKFDVPVRKESSEKVVYRVRIKY